MKLKCCILAYSLKILTRLTLYGADNSVVLYRLSVEVIEDIGGTEV